MPKAVMDAQKMHSDTMRRLAKTGKARGQRHMDRVKAASS